MSISLADVLRRFVPAYRQRYPKALLPSHERAIRDILGCHGDQTQAWLANRQAELLPVPYFHLTATVPEAILSGIFDQSKK